VDALLTPQSKPISHVIVNNRHYYNNKGGEGRCSKADSKNKLDRTDFQLRSRERENTQSGVENTAEIWLIC